VRNGASVTRSGQAQRGGDHSTNVQAGGAVTVVHAGLTVSDAKEMVLALALPEFERLTERATNIACERAAEMIEQRLMPRLLELHPEGVQTFEDPDVQFALLSAVRSYARTGDGDLADVLVDILVDRTKETERTIRQIALNESLEVASKLTPDQFDALSLVWLIRYTVNRTIVSRQSLADYIDRSWSPYISQIRTGNSSFQHLEYAGCGSVGVGGMKVGNIMRGRYAGVFSTGFTRETLFELLGQIIPPAVEALLMECLNERDLFQLAVMDEKILRDRCVELGVDNETSDKLSSLLKNTTMSETDVESQLRGLHECAAAVIDAWNGTIFGNFTLTTVGITIAHANCRRRMGESPADLSIWIN
jgi:hypothetical protein